MDLQNHLYALTQVIHNFGAVAVVGGSLLGRWPVVLSDEQRHRMAWVVLGGWLIQGVSGSLFGAVSYYYYGEMPDLHGIAVVALLVKMVCATSGFLLAVLFIRFGRQWTASGRAVVWNLLIALGITALSAAAVLRWFS